MSSKTLTTYQQWYGRDSPPDELRILRAGPLEVALDGVDLRYARLGDLEIVRRIYVAVRDINWNTITGGERQVEVTEAADSFSVECLVRHRRGPIDFEWRGRFEGSSDGTVSYEMDGRCDATFDYAKIGICLHHPSHESQGRRFRAVTPAGTIEDTFPTLIAPQLHLAAEGYDAPLFDPCSSLSIALEAGAGVQIDFEGSLFEMEDQRNWTDASFKTVSTPAYLGYRHHAAPDKRIRQRLTFRASVDQPRPVRRAAVDTLTLGPPVGRPLPPIGFGLPSDGEPHTEHELRLVRELRPDHLRADVQLGDVDALAAALAECRGVGCGIELALFVPAGREGALGDLADTLARSGVSVARIVLLGEQETSTPAALLREARARLAPRLPAVALVGGTNINFCDINRDRPDLSGLDAVAYSINAQVHAFDERSLAETPEGQADTVVSARALYEPLAVVVTPVTMRPRFNPDAIAGEEPERADDELPWEVDVRQLSSFCAAWTLGSVKALAEAGAASLTYYETAGWRGLFERDRGCSMPGLFPSTPGMVFPVYDAFMALRERAGDALVELRSSAPLDFVGLALERAGSLRLIVANLTHKPRTVRIGPIDVAVELEPFGVSIVDHAAP